MAQDFRRIINSNLIKNTNNEYSEIINPNTGNRGITVSRPDGSIETLIGSRSWRNNNPGNMEYNEYTRSLGAIGTDGRFAIFPDYATGRAAKETMLFSGKNYQNLTLTEAINRYAPSQENNTDVYKKAVLSAVGSDKKMSEYSLEERKKILEAMEKMEGYFGEKVVKHKSRESVADDLAKWSENAQRNSTENKNKVKDLTSTIQTNADKINGKDFVSQIVSVDQVAANAGVSADEMLPAPEVGKKSPSLDQIYEEPTP